MTTDLKHAFENMHLLSRAERKEAMRELEIQRPDFLRDFRPKWWWYPPCRIDVLLVTDGALDFETGGFGLSEFITSFNKLNLSIFSNVYYRVTLGHRGSTVPVNTNSVVVNRIANFDFVTSVDLNDFEQVWLFGFDTISLPADGDITRPSPVPTGRTYLFQDELDAITNYMNNGGGLFATGDHGSLGSALCSQIPRVQDMRYWEDFGTNEVGMTQARRNDTNRPASGATVSNQFNNQSDDIPQTIAVRTFGSGDPHPLLSISTSKRASGIIDIMPDHPHEGECKQETTFSITSPFTGAVHSISSQIIATSFVLDGSTASGKSATEPHCFPSIAVFDGRTASVGRIVVDSTWHHFVNINLIASTSGVGLTDVDFDVIQQYFMNIATWIAKRRFILCRRRWIIMNMLTRSQIIEASLNNPRQTFHEIKISDLYAIGMLAKEILSTQFTPSFAKEFMLDFIEEVAPDYAEQLNSWSPTPSKQDIDLVNNEFIVATAIGAGFIFLRDKYYNALRNDEFSEKSLDESPKVFIEGVKYGLTLATDEINQQVEQVNKLLAKQPIKRDNKKNK